MGQTEFPPTHTKYCSLPKISICLKPYSKISNEGNSNFRFVPYKIQSISKIKATKIIVLQHNIFATNTS